MKQRQYYFLLTAVIGVLSISIASVAQDVAMAHNIKFLQQENTTPSQSLKAVLKGLETEYGVFFTYKNASLDNKTVNFNLKSEGDINKLLDKLLKPQKLKYKKIDNIYVIYSEGEKIDFKLIKKISVKAEQESFTTYNNLESIPALKVERMSIIINTADITVKGKVVGESGEPMPGVNIAVKGTATGTTSDADGNYSITIPDNAILIFTFIGYASQEIAVGNRSMIDVSLVPDIKTLSEVVVVGYGTQERKDVTGSIASVDIKTIRDVPIQTADQALQGRMAGVDVQSNSGIPGGGVKINIRGVGTTNSTEPLYVIDGYYPGNINSLNPNDIASIDVLKDASASAIYGVLGANGVVIITTKRAKSGKPTVTLDSYWGQQTPRHYLNLLGNRDFATVSNNAKDNATIDDNFNNFISGKPGNINPLDGSNRVPSLKDLNNLPKYDKTTGSGDQVGKEINTDWQKEVYRTAMTRNHNLTISAGNDNSRLLVSVGYLKQDGVLKGTGFERMSLRLNGDVKFNKLTFGSNIYFAQEKRQDNSGGRSGGATTSITKASPSLAVYNSGPSYILGFNGNVRERDGQDAGNPLRDLIINDQINRNYIGLASIFAEYEIIPGLKYKLNLGGDMNIGYNRGYNPVYVSSDYDYRQLATLNEYNGRSFGLLAENTLSYEKTIGKHKFNLLAGYVARQSLFSSFSAGKNTFPVGDLIRVASAGKSATGYEGNQYNSSQLGILGRINYEYDKRFYVTANIRRDGSSRFGKDYLYGTFPSASLGWRLSQEEFVKNISFISNLFLRAGWGKIGNQDIGDYKYRAVINSYPVYTFNQNTLSTGGTLSDAANSKIRWETTTSSNIGLDISILNNKVSLTADYFDKTTSDILLTTPIPISTGYDGQPTTNVGKINNKGFELASTYQDKAGDLTWALGGNITFIKNKVVEINGDKSFIPGAIDGASGGSRPITRTEAGHPVGAFYGLVVEKVLQNNSEIYYNDAKDGNSGSTYGGSTLKPGDIKFKDLNGDGKIDAANDRTYIGSPFPNYSYGFYGRAGYKGFELQIQFQGVQGSQIFNLARYWTEGMQRNFNYDNHTLNRYISENTPGNGSVPRANSNDANNTQISNRYIESGSYLRLKNLTLGYNFNQIFLNKLHSISNLRIYATASNLLTFTKYTGYDPEVGAGYADPNNYAATSNLNRNVDNANYPIPKTLLIGIQVGF